MLVLLKPTSTYAVVNNGESFNHPERKLDPNTRRVDCKLGISATICQEVLAATRARRVSFYIDTNMYRYTYICTYVRTTATTYRDNYDRISRVLVLLK